MRLTYKVRVARRREVLQNIFEAAGIPGDDVLIRFASTLEYDPGDDVPTVVTSAVANARSRIIPVTVTGHPMQAGKLFSVGNRLYKSRTNATVGTGRSIRTGWPLRADIPSGTALNFANPTARFIIVQDPPTFPVRRYYDKGKRVLGGPIIVELVELL